MGTSKRMYRSAHGNVNFAESDSNTTNDEKKNVTNDIFGAVRYRPSIDREPLVRQYVRIRQNETTQLRVDGRKEVAMSAKYQAYEESFTSMLSKFQCM